jgi:hypothetical protein
VSTVEHRGRKNSSLSRIPESRVASPEFVLDRLARPKPVEPKPVNPKPVNPQLVNPKPVKSKPAERVVVRSLPSPGSYADGSNPRPDHLPIPSPSPDPADRHPQSATPSSPAKPAPIPVIESPEPAARPKPVPSPFRSPRQPVPGDLDFEVDRSSETMGKQDPSHLRPTRYLSYQTRFSTNICNFFTFFIFCEKLVLPKI